MASDEYRWLSPIFISSPKNLHKTLTLKTPNLQKLNSNPKIPVPKNHKTQIKVFQTQIYMYTDF